jgi:predicted KAP-like P-loop ATPase
MSFLDKIKNFSNAPKNTFSADGILGVIDEPISSKEEDLLGLRKHSNALVKFITNTQSPITIGIQGQWGSGKTSLLRSIEDDLKQHDQILQIWINAWESSLLSNPEETFIKIINEIITSLLSKDENTNLKDKITKNASTMFRGALRLTASITGGIAGQNVVDSILKSGIPNIKKLREDLSEAVKEINMRQSNPCTRIE